MPSSHPCIIEPTMQAVIDLNPESILDLGVGFGKYGFLCREYLETYRHQVFLKSEWKVRIDGVEVFTKYLQDHQKAIYDTLMPYDLNLPEIHDWISRTKYQLYLAMDVLEHLVRWKELLLAIPSAATIIVAVPCGLSEQGTVFDNVHEQHVVTFETQDLIPYFDDIQVIENKLFCIRNGGGS